MKKTWKKQLIGDHARQGRSLKYVYFRAVDMNALFHKKLDLFFP